MLVVHDWLKEYIGDSIPSADKIAELLMNHSFEIEGVEGDVIDVDILPNRASDCLCHRGIAREVASLLGTTLTYDPFVDDASLTPVTDKIAVEIEDENACRRFGAALVTGVTVGDSPEWLRARLEAVGQRSINNVVDVTNYVMLSLGQPLHAYDGDKLPQVDGIWKFGVRSAKDGEKVTTLSDDDYELDPGTLLITEGANDAAVGIAGIKGGKTAEVGPETKTVIFEAANFDPVSTRKSARKLKLQTDASKRFENEVSRNVVPHALREAVRLLEEIGGGTCEGYSDTYPVISENSRVTVTLTEINTLLGLSIDTDVVADIFNRLGFEYVSTDTGFEVMAPFERKDIVVSADLVEEVGRVHGYTNIAAVSPESVPMAAYNTRHFYSEKVREVLLALGFSEVITSSFRNKDKVRLQNALASDKGYMRSSLVRNMVEVLDKNIPNTDLLGVADIRAFEIGTVFHKTEDGVGEYVAVALGVRSKQQYTPKDDVILKEAKVALVAALGDLKGVSTEKGVMEFNLTDLLPELPVPTAYGVREVGEEKQYKPFSQYPYISRDISLWVAEGITEDVVLGVLSAAAGELLVRTDLFDEFTKDGKTSYAFRLIFQSYDKTLTDEEITPIMDSVNCAVEQEGWEVR